MNFKKWLQLQEVGTGTNSIAVFSRPIFSEPVRRIKKEKKNTIESVVKK